MEGKTTDKPTEARETPRSDDGRLSTEAQDPRAHRDAATAEQERLKKTTEQLPTVEIVEQPKPVDRAAMEKAADAIEYACNGGWTGAGTDTKAIFNILKDKTEAERKVIDEIFRQKYGKKYGDKGDGSDWGLAEEFKDEMSGDDLRYAMELLNRKDPAPRVEPRVMERAAADQPPAESGDGARPGRRTEAQPAAKPVDRNEMEKAADAIEYACNGGLTGAGTDKEAIYAILKDKSEAEIKVIDQIFREKYGKKYGDKGDGSDWGLEDEFRDEMSGADLDKALNLLNKKDGKADDAGRIHTALVERDQWIEGRSDAACEKDIRDTLATMNSKQIEEADRDYQQRYGKSLRDAIMTDPNLSGATKDACDIYLKGTDKRTADDTVKLADIAIKEKDIDMFQEAMRDASPEARKRFMDNDGEKRMKDAFGGIFSDTDFYHAKEYAEKGSLNTATKIRDNTSWMGDNEKAIEQALKEMSAEERKAYLDGRNLAAGKEVPGLSEEQKAQALKTYQEINAALKGAGNDTEVAKWEDQIAVKGGSLVTRLAAHRGSIYDDSMHDVLSTIEDMPEADWKRLKADPEFRKEIEGVLSTYLNEDEMKRARQVLDAKEKAETFDEAKASGRRSVLDAINDNVGTFNNKETNIYDAIEKMTPEEQRRYREDPEFRKQLDEAVGNALDAGAERDTAMGMLNKVAAGEKPTRGIVEKLNQHAADTDTDEAAVIRDMKKAFAEDPTLRERIVNPKTAEDQLLSTQFYNALHRALDTDEYERYAKPLLETGHLSMDVQMELNKGTFDDDEQAAYKDILALANDKNPAAQEERQKILNDKEYQDKVLGFLSDEERKVALYALEQGKMLPEDVIRSHLLGAGTGEEEVKQALAALKPEQIDQLKKDYARKYGEDLTYSLLDEMGGQDARDVKRLLRDQPTTGREAFNDARDEYYESRDGIGKWWVDNVWDGTGYMTDDAVNKFATAMSRSSAEFKELPPEQQKELTEQIQKNLDLFVESKGAAADMAVDAVIIAAAIAGAKFTGGVSLALLAKTALAGAAFKVAAKSAIMGSDYDWASSQVVVDALTGGVDAASIVVGPAQLAQVFRLGEKAAATATTKLLSEGGEQLLKAGAEKQLGKKMFEVVATAISNGAEGVDDKAIKALAKEFAKEGQEEALEAALKQNLKEAMEQEARTALKRTLTETTLNMEAGAIGGGTSGGIRGVAEWDTSKSVEENLRRVAESTIMGAGMGAAMAGTFTLAFKGLGKTWEAVRSAGHEPPPVHPDTDVVVNGQRVRANQEVVTFRADGSPATATDSGSRLQVSFMRDTDGRMLMLDHSESGTFVKRAGSDKFERIPFGEPVPIKPGDEVRLGSETGPKLDLGTAPKAEKGLSRAGNEGAAFDDLPATGTVRGAQEGPGSARVNSRHRDGKVATVTDIHGRQTSFEYGADGAVNKITHSDGTVLTTTDGKTWRIQGSDSSSPGLKSEFHVGDDGTLWQKTPGGELVGRHPDGSRVVREVDGTSRLYGPDNRMYELVTPNGQRTKIDYSNDGQITQLTHHDGTVVRTEDGVNWRITEPNGDVYDWRGRIELDGEGHLKRTAGGAESSPDARLRPGDRTVMMPVPTAPADWHGWKHYSMEMNGRVEKMTKAEMVIGRHGLQADIAVSDPGVSRRHAAVKMTPEGAFIRDLGSTNGTYVNGVKVEGEVKLKPGDRITLGKDGPEIRWKHEPPPPKPEEFKLEIRGQKQPLKKSEVVLGRDPGKADVVMGDAGVSRQHAVVRTGSDGVYIKDLGSTNGTYVNGVKIEGEYKLKPGDRITLGKDGPEIKLHHEPPPELKVPRKPLEYRPHSSGLDPAAEAGSVKQSNEFLARHEVREKLRDGFQNVGGVNFIDQAGRFHDTVRPSTVVDRTQDEVLNRAIADAHRRFDRLRDNPQELAKALAQYSKELLEPRGWSGDAVDKGYYALRKEFAGKRVLLGEFIERAARGEGAGVCQHQALLFKVLGDEFGLDVSFVRGYSGTRPPKAGSQLNHAWNEVFIDGQRLVFDPRQQVFGVPYEKLAYHTPGRDMPWLVRKPPDVQPAQVADAAAGRTPPGDVPPPVEPPRLRPEVPQEAPRQLINLDAKAGDRIQYQGKSWRVEGYNGITGDVILIKGGYRPMGAQEFAELNPGRQLKVGERYRVRRSSGAIEEGWRLEGVNPDGSLRMFKEDASRIQVPRADIAEANPHLVRPEAPQPRLDQPMAKVGDANVRLDEKQIALRDQPVRLEGRQGGGNSGHDMYLGEVQMPDGSYKEVIFHNAHDLGDGSSKSAVRYRKEMAAYKLNEIIGLDNGFPLTAPRDAVIEGQPVRGWVQERAGDPIERRLRSLAHQRYGGRGSSEDVSRLVREDPHLKQQMEQAFVERLIYGDGDDHALNFVMRDTPQGPKIQNIDLDYAFPPDREPQWFLVGNEGINKRLKADFSEQQLSEATLKKIRDFVSTHDTPAGRQRLAGLGLKPGEVEGILARARWLADNRRFPKARTLKEYRADLEQRGGE